MRKRTIAGIAALGAIALLLSSAWRELRRDPPGVPGFAAVRAAHAPSEALLIDRHGAPLDEVRLDFRARRLAWVPLGEMSPALVRAIVVSEDRRFWTHGGVDWRALASAAAGNFLRGERRGASTIPMQLASLVAPQAASGGRGRRRSFAEKTAQIRAALALERQWRKAQILEAYLNRVTFRGELQGIGAASRGLFAKDPAGLTDAEAAVLCALVRSPNADPARVARRAATLGRTLGIPDADGAVARAASDALSQPYRIAPRASLAPAVARKLLATAGEQRPCTLDSGLQQFVLESLSRQLDALKAQHVTDGAAVVADNRTGEILAYVANGGAGSAARWVDGADAPRQAGSTLKPFLYGLAVERRILTAASLIDDAPVDLPTEGGLYRPQNYDRAFRGAVSVRTALSASLNVPAVKTLNLVGEDAFARRLSALGFAAASGPERFGASLSLGAIDVTLLELVNAFRTLANGGVAGPLTLRPADRVRAPRRVMPRAPAFIVSDMLADRGARDASFGLDNPLATPFRASVKTGTSKDMRDNWCVGYSDRFTVGVWVGNFDGTPMWNVSGVSGAAPVWNEVMARLHAGAGPAAAPGVPAGVVSRTVAFPEEAEAARTEWFLSGTEPPEGSESAPSIVSPRIRYPADGMVVALDPDIPEPLQRIFFEARHADGFGWTLDGQPAGDGPDPAPWRPVRGTHDLALVGPEGKVAHAIRFSVRGREAAARPVPAQSP